MSELSLDVDWSCDLKHPYNKSNLALVATGNDLFRLRNLALGGQFQPEIDYRQEIAGCLHYQKRCQICAETVDSHLRPFTRDFDILFCKSCHDDYTLSTFRFKLT